MQYRLHEAVRQRLLKAPRVALQVCDSLTVIGDRDKAAQKIITDTLFQSKRCAVFSVSDNFDQEYSIKRIAEFERNYETIKRCGIDEVYCVIVGAIMAEKVSRHFDKIGTMR